MAAAMALVPAESALAAGAFPMRKIAEAEFGQLLRRGVGKRRQPSGLALDGLFKEVAHEPSVAELAVALARELGHCLL